MNLIAMSYCQPETFQTVESVTQRLGSSTAESLIFSRIFGLQKVPLDESKTIETWLCKAARACIENAAIPADKIQWMIHAHTANHIAPYGISPIRKVQQLLKLPHAKTFAVTMSKCASIFQAVRIMQQILNTDEY